MMTQSLASPTYLYKIFVIVILNVIGCQIALGDLLSPDQNGVLRRRPEPHPNSRNKHDKIDENEIDETTNNPVLMNVEITVKNVTEYDEKLILFCVYRKFSQNNETFISTVSKSGEIRLELQAPENNVFFMLKLSNESDKKGYDSLVRSNKVSLSSLRKRFTSTQFFLVPYDESTLSELVKIKAKKINFYLIHQDGAYTMSFFPPKVKKGMLGLSPISPLNHDIIVIALSLLMTATIIFYRILRRERYSKGRPFITTT